MDGGHQLLGVFEFEPCGPAVLPIEGFQHRQLLAKRLKGSGKRRRKGAKASQQLSGRELALVTELHHLGLHPARAAFPGRGRGATPFAEASREKSRILLDFDIILDASGTLSDLDNFDLHNHSFRSDGLLSPTQLIELASRTGVDAIALTDHDTTDGIEEAATAAKRLNIGFIPGVEISVSWGVATLHIVGLRVDPTAPVLVAGLKSIRDGRLGRAERIAAELERSGFEGTLNAALALAQNPAMIGRTHFARALAERGAVKDIQAAFDKYLAKGKRAYVAHRWASLSDAIAWIRASGGTAVLAHPGRYDLKPLARGEVLTDFRRLGGEAIEVVTGSHRPEQYATWQRAALEYGFLASRGADYHGPGESPCEPGRLPALHASLTPVWSKWAQ